MQQAGSSFDVIIDTIPTRHDLCVRAIAGYRRALVIVGNLGNMEGFSPPLILGRRITGSPSGGIAQTQEMLNFCAQKGFTGVRIIPIQQINPGI